MSSEFSYKEGDGLSFERFIAADDVKQFAQIVGDLNSIHLDAGFAEKSLSTVKVNRLIAEKRRLVLDANVFNANGEICLAGSATVWLPA